ncbi:hypothetical protein [Pseudomonas sp. CCI3.1]|uniref:hypothetical protein n=1 Tax=Pseudomonas sp. CCI3.1 TaxID=3048618 RepID=UPI002AB5B7DE|nr:MULTISPECIES: hypothetical protein [unclassified Pseudomonas]MDY7584969.1 hypothetical protein [Pseudomonas sp. CCI3.1]MEB0066312.1 hypothetical protein [Pseudomonas sp. CCI3.1]MEB0071630.1 hypothetical protein [Pseudomonas sp. CCI1.4]
MLAYPEGLPTPQREGYGFDPVSPMTSTKLVSGRSERRRAFVSTPTVATVTWLLTPSEAQLFEGWFEYVLLSGSLPFECPLLTPMGLEPYRANFVDIYSGPVLVGVDLWRFSAQLSLFKRPLIDKEWIVDAPDYILGSDIFDIAMNQKWPKQTEC